MSTSTEGLHVPEWDLADRLRKSLRMTDIGVQEMADYFEVSRNTISAWINGRTPPTGQSIKLWALRTGLPYEWFRDGKWPTDDNGPDGGGESALPTDPSLLLPRVDSNHEPSDWQLSEFLPAMPVRRAA